MILLIIKNNVFALKMKQLILIKFFDKKKG